MSKNDSPQGFQNAIKEMMANNRVLLKGKYGDGTPFNNVSVENIADALQECGYQRYGNEQLYSGTTGRPLKGGRVFIGPTYYQRLKHMVRDKIYSRNQGKVTRRNRQPPEVSTSHSITL